MALAIAALGLGLLVAATGTGLENTTAADNAVQAIAHAQSHLTEVGQSLPLRKANSARKTVFAGMSIADPIANSASGKLAIYPVTVTENWQGGMAQKLLALFGTAGSAMRSAARSTRSRAAGFTLIELLVALTVLSLLLVALSGGVHFAGRAWRAQEERIDRQGDVQAVQNVLRQMLASGKDFRGDGVSLDFVGRLPVALERGGLFDIALYAEGDKLKLSWRPHFKGIHKDLPRGEAVLLAGITGLEIRYFMKQGWSRAAADKTKPPGLIAIRTALSGGGRWPALLIGPATNPSSKPQT